MTDTRRDFLRRFAAAALVATGAGCETTAEQQAQRTEVIVPNVVYGMPPHPRAEFFRNVGDRVFFDYDKSILRPDAKMTLEKQVAWMARYPSFSVTVEGHADERGTREYNLALAEKRANAVKAFLVAKGVAATRIKVVSYGKERPEATGSNEASRSQNRRAVTIPD
jgi:peptidoglycan-associated lipoprotein